MSKQCTFTPENWGNLYFPEGCCSLEELEEELDSSCSNGHFSRWTSHGNSCYSIAAAQLGTGI